MKSRCFKKQRLFLFFSLTSGWITRITLRVQVAGRMPYVPQNGNSKT